MARFAGQLKGFPPLGNLSGDWKEALRPQEEALEALRVRSDGLRGGDVVGALLRWQRADGYAYYLVTKDHPLTVAYIDWMDGYRVEPALIRGLSKADVLSMLHRDQAWARLVRRE